MKPSEILEAKPEMCSRMKADQRAARSVPSTAVMRGLCRMAESRRCSTNQFSTQPAIMLEANSTTPVNAAHSSVGPSSVSDSSTWWALSGIDHRVAQQPAAITALTSSTAGTTMKHIAKHGRHLRAHQVRDFIDKVFQRRGGFVRVDVLELGGHGRRRHGRLLGGQREMQQLDQDEVPA